MAKRERPLNVLLIDDLQDQMQEFKTVARQNRIIIKSSHTSAEDGLGELSNNISQYDAVILDGKAFKNKNQVPGTEGIGSLIACIHGIEKIERENKRKIPFCVYTGYMEKVEEIYEKDIQVFEKGTQREEVFTYLKEEVKKLPETEVIWQYSEVFELFDQGCLNLEYRDDLLHVLMNMESRQPQELRNSLSTIRNILEGIYKKLDDIGWLPDQVFTNNRLNLESCYRYISGLSVHDLDASDPLAPDHIQYSLRVIKDISSAVGAHDYKEPIHNFTLKATVFAMLDVLLWFKEFVNEKTQNIQ